MSQEKVDRYKKEKANRKKTLKKEKYKSIAIRICTVLICAVIVGWGGYSIYNRYEKSRPTKYLTLDPSALEDYLGSLSEDDK
jgi:hypothetical protein